MKGLTAEKVSAADKYCRAQDALLKLGLSETDDVLQPLVDNDLWMKNISMTCQIGNDDKPDPWFWNVRRPGGMTMEEQSEWSKDSKFTKCDYY